MVRLGYTNEYRCGRSNEKGSWDALHIDPWEKYSTSAALKTQRGRANLENT